MNTDEKHILAQVSTIDFCVKMCYHGRFVKSALPIVTVTRQDLALWIDAEFDLPEVYELMVGYRQYLQLVHGDVMNINAIYEAFIEAAQEAGKLIIIEG